MRNLLKRLGAVVFLALLGFALISPKTTLAASAKVDLTAEKSTVTVGDFLYVYININSQTTFTDFVANLPYDPNVLEYVNDAKVISGGNGLLRINDANVMNGSKSRKYALKFKTLKVGTVKLSLEDTTVYDESGTELSISSEELNASIKAKATASTNANLKSLKSDPEFTPVFQKNVHEYNVTVDQKTEQLFIVAEPEDKKATVSITGNEALKEGENKVVITVLAESGNVIEYNINVTREKSTEATITVTPEEDPDSTTDEEVPVSSSSIKLLEGSTDQYLILNGTYKVVSINDEDIPEGYTRSEITISGASIESFVLDNDMQSDFVLLFLENGDGGQDFYQYDTVEKTLQRFIMLATGDNNTEEIQGQLDLYKSNFNKAAIAIAILSVATIFFIITTIRLMSQRRRRRR